MSMTIPRKSYIDADGNTYRIEQVVRNKMFICVRTNSGGNRKGWKNVGAQKSLERAQHELDVNAQRNGWKEVKA